MGKLICTNCHNSDRFVALIRPSSLELVINSDGDPVSVSDQDIGDDYEVIKVARCEVCRSTAIEESLC